MPATFPAYLIVIELIILIIFDEDDTIFSNPAQRPRS
jgi:hypothetical protein